MNLQRLKNYDFLNGPLGLLSSIFETALAGGAAALIGFWFFDSAGTRIAGWLAYSGALFFIAMHLVIGLKCLEYCILLGGNPGVSKNDLKFVENVGMVPFLRGAIALISACIYAGVTVWVVISTVMGFT